MPNMTDAELAAQDVEGSFARQDAIRAARRRLGQKSAPVDHGAIDRIVTDCAAKDQSAFDALITNIDTAQDHGSGMAEMMKKVARAALKKSFPQYADTPQPVAAE